MKKLFQTMLETLESGRDVVLCNILASSGSSPRGAGSKMLVFENGDTFGTIGGGAVELTAARQALDVFRTRQPYIKGFRLAPNDVEDIGMICGGDVTVYYQLFTHGDVNALSILRRAVELASGDKSAWLVSRIDEACLARMGVYDEERGLQFFAELGMDELRPMLRNRAVYVKGEPTYYVEPITLAGWVYIFGGGHVGRALAPMLSGVGFRVAVFDNRERVAGTGTFHDEGRLHGEGRLPGAEKVILGDYRDIGKYITISKDDYVVIMTPGHQADYEVLEQALRTPATYVGCIGSRRKVAATRARLLDAGIAPEVADSVHSPIGLAIGAETPEEIAVSITAELISHRAGLR